VGRAHLRGGWGYRVISVDLDHGLIHISPAPPAPPPAASSPPGDAPRGCRSVRRPQFPPPRPAPRRAPAPIDAPCTRCLRHGDPIHARKGLTSAAPARAPGARAPGVHVRRPSTACSPGVTAMKRWRSCPDDGRSAAPAGGGCGTSAASFLSTARFQRSWSACRRTAQPRLSRFLLRTGRPDEATAIPCQRPPRHARSSRRHARGGGGAACLGRRLGLAAHLLRRLRRAPLRAEVVPLLLARPALAGAQLLQLLPHRIYIMIRTECTTPVSVG
jgi:hypothetical protein